MAKLEARDNFANSGGTREPEFCNYSQMAKRREIKVYAREWRDKLEWTLDKASSKSGIGLSYLSDLEKGTGGKRWNIDHIVKLAIAYGLDDPQDLFRHPNEVRDPVRQLVDRLSRDQRETVELFLTAILKKAGTGK